MHALWTQVWWVWGIRGAVAGFFGVTALLYPAPSLLLALLLFGACFQLDGLAAVAIATTRGLQDRTTWPLAATGLLGLLGGMLLMMWPGLSAGTLAIALASLCLLRGALELAHGLQFREWQRPAWPMMFGGVLTIVFSVVLFAAPALATDQLVWSFAGYVAANGLCLIAAALRMRELEAALLPSRARRNDWTA